MFAQLLVVLALLVALLATVTEAWWGLGGWGLGGWGLGGWGLGGWGFGYPFWGGLWGR